jgi:hypothetical protein
MAGAANIPATMSEAIAKPNALFILFLLVEVTAEVHFGRGEGGPQ